MVDGPGVQCPHYFRCHGNYFYLLFKKNSNVSKQRLNFGISSISSFNQKQLWCAFKIKMLLRFGLAAEISLYSLKSVGVIHNFYRKYLQQYIYIKYMLLSKAILLFWENNQTLLKAMYVFKNCYFLVYFYTTSIDLYMVTLIYPS